MLSVFIAILTHYAECCRAASKDLEPSLVEVFTLFHCRGMLKALSANIRRSVGWLMKYGATTFSITTLGIITLKCETQRNGRLNVCREIGWLFYL
jgi:hypothetical protein